MVVDEELMLFWICNQKSRGVIGGRSSDGGQGGCERRIEVIVKMHKNKFGGGGPGLLERGSGWM